MMQPIITLIQDYLSAVADAVARVQKDIGADLVRQGPGGGRFPRFGNLSDGSEYQFHGIGLSVESGDIDVNFDFGTGGRYDGFDAWSLWCFAKQQLDRYPTFQDKEDVDEALRHLISERKVVGSTNPDRDRLFYLAGSTPRVL